MGVDDGLKALALQGNGHQFAIISDSNSPPQATPQQQAAVLQGELTALSDPKAMSGLAAQGYKHLALGIPESMQGDVDKFQQHQMTAQQFSENLAAQRAEMNPHGIASADQKKIEDLVTADIQAATASGVKVHAIAQIDDTNGEKGKAAADRLRQTVGNDKTAFLGTGPVGNAFRAESATFDIGDGSADSADRDRRTSRAASPAGSPPAPGGGSQSASGNDMFSILMQELMAGDIGGMMKTMMDSFKHSGTQVADSGHDSSSAPPQTPISTASRQTTRSSPG